MKVKSMNLIWGFGLVLAGGIFLAMNFGLFTALSGWFWTLFFGVLSALFFASYIMNGPRSWPWLFPAAALLGVAGTIFLNQIGLEGSYVGAPVLGALVIPFLAAYLVDTRQNWWALIPGWVMLVLTLITIVTDWVPGEVVGSAVLFGIALPFFVVYLADRRHWWALIPAGVMGVVALIPLLALVAGGDIFPVILMTLFSLPFLVVYLMNREHWWALIPAGVFISIALTVLAATIFPERSALERIPAGVIFLGFSGTFLVLWLLRAKSPTAWAIYPAAALAILGLGILALGQMGANIFWPLVIIAGGGLLLVSALRSDRA